MAAILLGWVNCGQALADEAISPYPGGTALDSHMVNFVLGNVQFVVLHEVAHLLIGEFEIPVFGPEEIAADYVAATVLLQQRLTDPSQGKRALEYLLAVADAFKVAWRQGEQTELAMRYWDTHTLTIQRFYQVACLIFGSDPERFASLPDRIGMTTRRAANCPAEFRRSDRAVRWLLDTYGRQASSPPGRPVRVRYDPPETVVSGRLIQQVRDAKILENTARRLQDRFALPRTITFVVRSCGQSESAWVPERRELVICHELLDTFYRLSLLRQANGVSGPMGND